jgi:hypothetical protein
MEKTNEPEEIAEARELLKTFEKSPRLSKKTHFSEGIEILNDFLKEHPDSKFSERANNLKKIHIELLIKRLGTIPFSNFDEWVKVIKWVFKQFSEKEREKLLNDPALKDHWHNFLIGNIPYLKDK